MNLFIRFLQVASRANRLGVAVTRVGLIVVLLWIGGLKALIMSVVTLSFLVTTPECWVPPLGDGNHGFPFLSGAGRLVIKDAIMMGAALVTMADKALAYLRRKVAAARAEGPELGPALAHRVPWPLTRARRGT